MRIAIVGSGVSGLAAFWALNRSGKHHVELFEKEERVGGHAHTVEVKREGKEACWVETAFLLINRPGWPNFSRFLAYLNIPLVESDASFSLTKEGKDELAWGSRSLWTLFGQWRNVFNLDLYRMVFDIFRFNYFALDLLRSEDERDDADLTVAGYLEREGYSRVFKDDYLLPLIASIWSIPLDIAATFPITTLVQSFNNHHLLQLWRKPKWYSILGGSKVYVDRIMQEVPPERVHTGVEVAEIKTGGDGVTLTTASGETTEWDHVIIATHSNTTRHLLEAGSSLDRELRDILTPCEWSEFDIWVHWDESAMPPNKQVWAAWNDIILTRSLTSLDQGKTPNTLESDSRPDGDRKSSLAHPRADYVSVTFDMNLLQNLPMATHGRIFETLNPAFPLDPSKVHSVHHFAQPVINSALIRSQRALAAWQAKSVDDDNSRRISIVGAWTGFGFHEDGFMSGLKAVMARREWGVEVPFEVGRSKREVIVMSEIGAGERVARGLIGLMVWGWWFVGLVGWA